MSNRIKVFLGGTTSDSVWRSTLIPLLKVDYFDPVVNEWTEADRLRELEARVQCDYCLYVITAEQKGIYSIAELVDDSNKRPNQTLFFYYTNLKNGMIGQYSVQDMAAVAELVGGNGVHVFHSLPDIAEFLNSKQIEPDTRVVDGVVYEDFGYDGDDGVEISMEAKDKWSDTVTEHAKWHPPKGFFKRSAEGIAKGLIEASDSKRQAVARLEFYKNRQGTNLSKADRAKLKHALELIREHYDRVEVDSTKPKSAKW